MPRMDSPLPSLQGEGITWLNSDPVTNEQLKGSPVVVHFWSISCGICKESLPDIDRWRETYGKQGLKIISVHMPRQESDTNIDAVKEAVADYEVKQPVAVDNLHAITDAFENKYVPAFYLFDADHKMRQFNAGEKAIKMLEPAIERVLGISKQEAKA